jgi:hypothetical protein
VPVFIPFSQKTVQKIDFMKTLLIAVALTISTLTLEAQANGGNNGGQAKPGTQTKKTAGQQRGTGKIYGARDTTPGSPMGTGGAGGEDMSGSPAGSAIETKDQTSKAEVQQEAPKGSQASTAKKANTKTKSRGHKNRRM